MPNARARDRDRIANRGSFLMDGSPFQEIPKYTVSLT
jgi:hypothetical protein